MAQISEEELNKLLTALYESLCKFASSYKSDNNITKKNADDYLSRILALANDVKKAVNDKKTIHDVTIYDAYIMRLSVIAEHIINKESGFFGDKELLILANAIKENIAILNKTKENFIATINQKNQNDITQKETSESNQIQLQLENLTKQLRLSEEKSQVKINEVEQRLNGNIANIKQSLAQAFSVISIQAEDKDYEFFIEVLSSLSLESSAPRRITSNLITNTVKAYFPFPSLKDKNFAIENFDSDLLQPENRAACDEWREKEENKFAYDKLKLSECVNVNMYAAIIKLSLFIKLYDSKDSNPIYKSNAELIEAAKKILSNLAKAWDKPWTECKETIVQTALESTPSLLKALLTEILNFNYADNDNVKLYNASEKRRQAFGSLIAYKGLKEHHLLPKNLDSDLIEFFKSQRPQNNIATSARLSNS